MSLSHLIQENIAPGLGAFILLNSIMILLVILTTFVHARWNIIFLSAIGVWMHIHMFFVIYSVDEYVFFNISRFDAISATYHVCRLHYNETKSDILFGCINMAKIRRGRGCQGRRQVLEWGGGFRGGGESDRGIPFC